VPVLAGSDEPADELAVDVLPELAGGSSSTAHEAGGDERAQDRALAPMLGTGVLAVDRLSCEVAAAPRAVAGVGGERLELAPAVVAASEAVGDPPEHATGRSTASPA
jgi:hypothetical protein